jgi:hypothetical protein
MIATAVATTAVVHKIIGAIRSMRAGELPMITAATTTTIVVHEITRAIRSMSVRDRPLITTVMVDWIVGTFRPTICIVTIVHKIVGAT